MQNKTQGVRAVKHAISQTEQGSASSCYMSIISRLKISLPISRFENSNSDLINIRMGFFFFFFFFFKTLSKNQMFRIHPNDGNGLF